ncbi:MAG: hypothetical protein AAGF11_37045 [Myxococcota bacterium]
MMTQHLSRTSVAPGALLLLCTACFDPIVTGALDGGTGESDSEGSDSALSASTGLDESGDTATPVCGDGLVEGDEVCDDGINNGSYGGCAPNCNALGPSCGDGIVNGTEACDDGDEINGNGCNIDCVVSGSVLWTVTYDGPGNSFDGGGGIVVDSDDNVIVSGTVAMQDERLSAWLRKYNPDGAAIWTEFYESEEGDSVAGPLLALDDDSIVFGGTFDTEDSSNDAWAHRITTDGEPIWSVTHGSASGGYDYTIDIERDASGAIYAIFDEQIAPTDSGRRTILRKYSPEGSELWTVTLQDGTYGHSLAVDPNGTCITTGGISSSDFFVPYFETITSDGDRATVLEFPSYGHASFGTASIDSQNNLAVILSIVDSGHRIIVFDEKREIKSEIFPHPSSLTILYTLRFSADEAIVAGGMRGDTNELWISKYDQAGSELWTNSYNGEDWAYGTDVAIDITVDSQQNVLAIGSIQENRSSLQDIWIGKFAP